MSERHECHYSVVLEEKTKMQKTSAVILFCQQNVRLPY